jgi:hypothetical protein
MSISFFISPTHPSVWIGKEPVPTSRNDFRIDPVHYSHALMKRWPSAREWTSEYFARGVYWTLDEYNLRGIEVHLDTNLQDVSFTPYGINFVEFVLWHREYVAADQILYLFNDSAWEGLVMQSSVTKEDIVAFTGMSREVAKESPFNGTWDGFVVASQDEKLLNYPLTLHLFVYEKALEAECLMKQPKPDTGSIYTYLDGHHNLSNTIHLFRLDRTSAIGKGLDSEIREFKLLRLDYEEGNPPKLKGICAAEKDGIEVIIGNIELVRRGLYDPPPTQAE